MNYFKFDNEFMFGTATSSTQIEGGDKNNTWYKWCEEGHIKDSSSCIRACDHWNRIEEDTELLKNLHIDTHRMSLEWSRIEPTPGEFSEEAMNHYRSEIQLLLNNNIKPLVTLHHFSDPIWYQEIGGWTISENTKYFINYVQYVIENLGDIVSDWVTFNEPNVYTIFGYLFGIFPPGIKSTEVTFKVIGEIVCTHIKIYNLIHTIRNEKKFNGKTKIGLAIHFRIFDGLTYSGKLTAKYVDYMFHHIFLVGFASGKLLFPIPKNDNNIEMGNYMDFLGVNYYTRNIVEFTLKPSNYCYKLFKDKNLQKSDLGWDIYPKGIYRVCKKYYKKYKMPIYITENGISDKYDNRRPNYIFDHLAFLLKAINEGINVERYYHWSLMDNFEWNEGESARFGLYQCNYDIQIRTARKSVELYTSICRNKELTEEMLTLLTK